MNTAPLDDGPTCDAVDVIDDRYAIVRPISRGGMGEVFEARDRVRARSVAVKIVRRDLRGRSEVRDRLRREADVLAAVHHPHVLSLLDAGTCPRVGPYIVTEHLHGRSLDGLLAARASIGVDGAIRVLREMAAALGEVHRGGYVHRDVKPANVFVARSPIGVETLQLLDFGIAAPAAGHVGLGGHGITTPGEFLGSLGYVAPEQLASASRAEPRSDLYALALVVLECLGRPQADLGARTTSPRLASAALAGQADVGPGLVELLDAMLALDPARRPESADDVIARLDAAVGPSRGGAPLLLTSHAPPAPRTASEPTRCEPAIRRAAALVDRRRATPRAPYRTPMMLVQDGVALDGRVEDVGEGGVLFVAIGDRAPVLGAATAWFAVPATGERVAVPVEVRWIRQHETRTAAGLAFASLPDGVREAIRTYVEWHVRWLVLSG